MTLHRKRMLNDAGPLALRGPAFVYPRNTAPTSSCNRFTILPRTFAISASVRVQLG